LPDNCLSGVHNEIHNMQMPSEALLSQVFQVVAKVIKGQRAYFVSDQRPQRHIRSPKGTVPFGRGLYSKNTDANINATMGMRTHQTSALVVA